METGGMVYDRRRKKKGASKRVSPSPFVAALLHPTGSSKSSWRWEMKTKQRYIFNMSCYFSCAWLEYIFDMSSVFRQVGSLFLHIFKRKIYHFHIKTVYFITTWRQHSALSSQERIIWHTRLMSFM